MFDNCVFNKVNLIIYIAAEYILKILFYKIYNSDKKHEKPIKKIDKDLVDYKSRYKISKVPNITNIVYGRTVGYKIKKINLGEKIEKISATKIRRKLRKLNKL